MADLPNNYLDFHKAPVTPPHVEENGNCSKIFIESTPPIDYRTITTCCGRCYAPWSSKQYPTTCSDMHEGCPEIVYFKHASLEYAYTGEGWAVSPAMKATFDVNGYVIVRNLFCKDEVRKILKTVLEGNLLKHAYKVPDTEGHSPILALWQHPGNDVTGMMARCEKVVTTAESLLGVEELYHYHAKVIIKEPGIGGKFEWHQDYGYWYNYCMRPDMMAVFIAIDECTQENGGLKVLRGTHTVGRVDHGKTGGQQGADTERVELLKKHYLVDNLDLNPGDAIFFHGNLLHASGPNTSKKRRIAFNVSFNEKSNSPVKPDICPVYTKLEKVPDTAILECHNYTDFTGKNFIERGTDKLVDFTDQTQSYNLISENNN